MYAERVGRREVSAHAIGVFRATSGGRLPAFLADLESRCCGAMGDETWEEHVQIGRAMTGLQVVEEALALPVRDQPPDP